MPRPTATLAGRARAHQDPPGQSKRVGPEEKGGGGGGGGGGGEGAWTPGAARGAPPPAPAPETGPLRTPGRRAAGIKPGQSLVAAVSRSSAPLESTRPSSAPRALALAPISCSLPPLRSDVSGPVLFSLVSPRSSLSCGDSFAQCRYVVTTSSPATANQRRGFAFATNRAVGRVYCVFLSLHLRSSRCVEAQWTAPTRCRARSSSRKIPTTLVRRRSGRSPIFCRTSKSLTSPKFSQVETPILTTVNGCKRAIVENS